MTYQGLVQKWHDFYIVAGTASATLAGLLFVGLSLHLRAVIARPEVRGLARATLANFALVLFMALFLLIPQDGHSAGLELQISGLATVVIISAPLLAAGRRSTRVIRMRLLVLRFGFSILSYAGAVTAGVLLTNGSFDAAFSCLVAVTMTLLVVSLRNTWDLLVSVGAATLEHESRPH